MQGQMSAVFHSGDTRISGIHAVNYRSSLRNKLVAAGFYLTGNIEKYSSGFIRIRKALREYPEVKFEVDEFADDGMADPLNARLFAAIEMQNAAIERHGLGLSLCAFKQGD